MVMLTRSAGQEGCFNLLL